MCYDEGKEHLGADQRIPQTNLSYALPSYWYEDFSLLPHEQIWHSVVAIVSN